MSLLTNEQTNLMEILSDSDNYLSLRRFQKEPAFILSTVGSPPINRRWSTSAVLSLWHLGWVSVDCNHDGAGGHEIRWAVTVLGVRSFNIIREKHSE